MKISEFIKHLQTAQKEHGDKELVVFDRDTDTPYPVDGVAMFPFSHRMGALEITTSQLPLLTAYKEAKK